MVRNFGMQIAEPFDMGLIDYRFLKLMLQRLVYFPVISIANDNGFWNIRRAVQRIERQVFVGTVPLVAENRLMPDQLADQLPPIRIDQKFVGVKTFSLLRFVRTVDPVAVNQSGSGAGQIKMPDIMIVFKNFEPLDLLRSTLVKQTKLHLFGMSGKQCKIHSSAVISRTERIRVSWLWSE